MNKTVIWPNQRENQIWKNFLVPKRDSIPQPISRRFPRDITSEPALSGFEPISGKKLRVFLEARFLKHRYIFLRFKTAFSRHFITIKHFIY
jgi:hypothetical protein